MSFRFNAKKGLIIVPSEIEGPEGSAVLRLALDTGATSTVINPSLVVALGYDIGVVPDRVEMTTGSGIEFAVRIALSKIIALGEIRTSFPVLVHALPPSAGVDGMLGLDFFRDRALTINFRRAIVEIA